MKCPVCASSDIELINIDHAFFRHMDFATVRQSGCVGRCVICQSLFNKEDPNAADNFLESKDYALSNQTRHVLNVKEYKEPVTRSFLQAELLYELCDRERPTILDIGCFDGELLSELDSRFQQEGVVSDLHGFDLNEHLGLFFPKKNNFHFWSSDINNVQGKFDMICMSHIIIYVRDMPRLMEQIKRLIKPDGLLFIQLPDVSKNPCYILMGDQYHYYTINTLGNVLRFFGFELSLLDTKWFRREIAGVAKLASEDTDVAHIEDLQIYKCVDELNSLAARVDNISINSQTGVLGTTVNAAFVDSILGERVAFFVDENPNRIGPKFRNKKVLHPRSLDDSDVLIIPYMESSLGIKERFENEYKCHFICV